MAVWDANVILAALFENSNADDKGNYTLSNRNTPLYSSAVKHDGAYSYYKDGNGSTNTIELPTQLATDLNALNYFTIEFWGYHDDSKRYAFYFNKGATIVGGFIWLYSDTTTNDLILRWNGNQIVLQGDFSTYDQWVHFAITYSNPTGAAASGTVKVYKNNSLIATLTSQSPSFDANNTNFILGGEVQYNLATFNYLDNFIVSNNVRTSFPTLPLTAPSPTTCTPDEGPRTGGTSVTIAGTDFASGATVTFDGVSATDVTFVSATEITCTTPAGAAIGLVDIIVTNPDTQAGTITDGFTYISTPTVTLVDPEFVDVLGGEVIALTGTDFYSGVVVSINGVDLSTTYVSSTSLTFTTAALAAGIYDIVVTNTDGGTVTVTDGITFYVVMPKMFDTKAYPQQYSIFITDKDITSFQIEPFVRAEELNVIDTFDFTFNKVSASAPIEFLKFLSKSAINKLKVKENNKTIYIGNISGIKSEREIDFFRNRVTLESFPLIEDMSTLQDTYAITTQNPVDVLQKILSENLPSDYTLGNISRFKALLSGLAVSIDTDSADDNIMSIMLDICEIFNIGIYMRDLEVNVYPAQVFPATATDISAYLIKKPAFKSRSDLFADSVSVTYKNDSAATEETVTAGTGTTLKAVTISDPLFVSDAVAQLIAERTLETYEQPFYECAEMLIDKTSPFELGQLVKYPSAIGDFICLIIGKETSRQNVKLKLLGVLK